MKIVSNDEIVLKLLPNKKWSSTAGFITAKTVTVGSKSYPISGQEGVSDSVSTVSPPSPS